MPSRKRAAKKPPRLGVMAAAERSDAPQQAADAPHPAHTEFVQHDANRKLAQRVGPVIGGGEITKSDIGDGEGRDRERRGPPRD